MAKGKKSPRKNINKSPVKVTKKQILEQKRQKVEIEDQERNFNENLIVAVSCRAYIYDRYDPNHDRRKMITKAWNDISEEVGRPVGVCQTRWRSLRDTFKRKYADWTSSQSGDGQDDSNNKPTWPWFESLLFLKDCNIPEKTVDSLQLSQAMDGNEDDISGESDAIMSPTLEYNIVELSFQLLLPNLPRPIKDQREVTATSDVVMEKLVHYIESQTTNNGNTSSMAFVQYLEVELESLCEEDREEFPCSSIEKSKTAEE